LIVEGCVENGTKIKNKLINICLSKEAHLFDDVFVVVEIIDTGWKCQHFYILGYTNFF
jgi:hypothetical protein